jgi:hypothetical protein
VGEVVYRRAKFDEQMGSLAASSLLHIAAVFYFRQAKQLAFNGID